MAAIRHLRIQYASNLHLERYEKVVYPQVVKPCARILALGGNIGRYGHGSYHSFLRWVGQTYDTAVYVAGPAEYHDIDAIRNSLPPNIMMLCGRKPSTYLARQGIAVVGASMAHGAEIQNVRDHADYYARLSVPILALTYNEPLDTQVNLRAQAWIYGNVAATRSGMHNGVFCVANGRRNNSAYSPEAFVELKLHEEEHTGQDEELAAAASGIRPPALA